MDRAETTQLLHAALQGDTGARETLYEHLYEALRRIARQQLRRGGGAPLDTTELVHEAFVKMCEAEQLSATDRAHFLALSARAMRQILVDHFRRRSAAKRGGASPPLTLEEGVVPVADRGEVLLALDDALGRLSRLSERTGRVVEMKFFGGLTEPEIADALEVSVRTVSTEWRKARAWLTRELGAA